MNPLKSISLFSLSIVVGIGFSLASTDAIAALYKYTDDKGQVVYSDKPPMTPGTKATEVRTTSTPDPEALNRLRKSEADLQKRMKARADDEQKAAEEQKKREELMRFCRDVRASLQQYKSARPLYRLGADNKRVMIQDAERDQEVKRLEEMYAKRKCE